MYSYTVSYLVNGVVETADITADTFSNDDGVLQFYQSYSGQGVVKNFAFELSKVISVILKA